MVQVFRDYSVVAGGHATNIEFAGCRSNAAGYHATRAQLFKPNVTRINWQEFSIDITLDLPLN
jgi:hypothetical protein